MFLKKLLQRVIVEYRIKVRRKDQEKRQKNKNTRLAKLLDIKRGIK